MQDETKKPKKTFIVTVLKDKYGNELKCEFTSFLNGGGNFKIHNDIFNINILPTYMIQLAGMIHEAADLLEDRGVSRSDAHPTKCHNLKCDIEMFNQKAVRLKPWDYRLNDRNFIEGDLIIQMEYDTTNDVPKSRQIVEKIESIVYGGKYDIPEGYCIMTVREINRSF